MFFRNMSKSIVRNNSYFCGKKILSYVLRCPLFDVVIRNKTTSLKITPCLITHAVLISEYRYRS
jgi:hypothetical protein